ncbi:hypothetical protein ACEOSV_29885 [Pseudomonas aeruginosa]|uniref:hypothetical protein n=1 Tax=Pseudomonas aeruginosa TaxID=287 RepID=UPI0037589A38|nr:hypothetical protein [Pseudomonas aeruginosa]
MNSEDRQHLLAERTFLKRMLAETPPTARLTRMSEEARLRKVEAQLAALPTDERTPARARLTFDGVPVIRSHGIFADFGMKAVSSFTDAVASVAASLSAPLAAMGPIPNRDQNQLLITNTAVGSFGFELEEYRAEQLALNDESPVATALERTQALLQSTLGDDEVLADIASETDPRALDKVRAFLKVLADNSAVCALQYGGRGVRFTDVGQVSRSLARLEADNLHESEEQLRGEFVGVLPNSRSFEFKLASDGQIIRGKVSPRLQNVDDINGHLHQTVQIEVTRTQVGNGRPRYLLTQMPQWAQS